MPVSDVVNVVVTSASPGVTALGFGTPLILSYSVSWPERFRSYGSIDDVLVDFATTTPEYQAAETLFEQNPAPTRILIGRGANKPTMVRHLSIVTVTAGLLYKVNAFAAGVLQSASYTATGAAAWAHPLTAAPGDIVTNDGGKLYVCITGGSDGNAGGPTGTTADITDGTIHWMYAGAGGVGATSNDIIAYNLSIALNALAAPDIGATSALSGAVGSKIVVTTADAAANWFALEPLSNSDPQAICLTMAQVDVTPDPGIVADLDALANASSDWYGLVLLFKSAAIVATSSTTSAGAWIEAKGGTKILIVTSDDTECATVVNGSATDIGHVLKGHNWKHTAWSFHPRAYEFLDAGMVGRWFPINPGADNWRLKTIAGPVAVHITPSQQVNITAKRGAYYYNITQSVSVVGGEGTVASGEYIDVIRFIAQYTSWVSTDLVNLAIQREKIPYTDGGVTACENVLRKNNQRGINAGGIAPTPTPTVSAPLVANVSAGDKSTRTLNNLDSEWTLAGAINHLNVNVTASV